MNHCVYNFNELPGDERSIWFGLLLQLLCADIKGSQIHTEELSNSLSAVDVAIFIQSLEVDTNTVIIV